MTPAKPKMLFVDDRSKRIHAALSQMTEFNVTIAPNVPEALRLLSSHKWDTVYLDFDLDGNDFVDPDSKMCAMEIVRYFQKSGWPENKPIPFFVIHSTNVFGAEMLHRALIELLKHHPGFRLQKIRIEPFVYEGEA